MRLKNSLMSAQPSFAVRTVYACRITKAAGGHDLSLALFVAVAADKADFDNRIVIFFNSMAGNGIRFSAFKLKQTFFKTELNIILRQRACFVFAGNIFCSVISSSGRVQHIKLIKTAFFRNKPCVKAFCKCAFPAGFHCGQVIPNYDLRCDNLLTALRRSRCRNTRKQHEHCKEKRKKFFCCFLHADFPP